MNFRIFTLLWTSCMLETLKCSKVIDSRDQKGLYISDYCPKMEYCAEGAHVMCMFYNPHSQMGPRCSHPRNVTITRDLANKLLEVTNAIRSKVALGKEMGQNGLLPRAYGMFRLKWDNELATFAQVLANQCVLRHDLCRASKKFPDPGQTAGLVRFSYPEWFPVSQNAQFTKPGLTVSKLNYATTQSLKSWYSQKKFVTSDMIFRYPDWEKNPNQLNGRLYLEMIHGATTHMGCGMSAYTEYAYHNNKASLNYNSVQIICNYSARPRKDLPVYTTTPPSEVDYTVRCGCPSGTEEDIDCLCSESPKKEVPTPPKQCEGINCKPAVVLLPIFTVEDAPPPQPPAQSRRSQNSNIVHYAELDVKNSTINNYASNEDIFGAYEVHENVLEDEIPNANIDQPQFVPPTSYNSMDHFVQDAQPRRQPQAQPKSKLNERIQRKDVKNRYFDDRHQYLNPKSQKRRKSDSRKNERPKQSVFSRVHKFELPKRDDYDDFKLNHIGKDVAPRKDFAKVHKLLDNYLIKKRKHEEISPEAFHMEGDIDKAVLIPTYQSNSHYKTRIIQEITTEIPRSTTELKVVNFDRYLKNKFHYQDFNISKEPIKRSFDIKNSNEESDKKLMNLLDTLEQEVKHIELDMNGKEIFDAKIRKIYGTVVGKPPDLLTPNLSPPRSKPVIQDENSRRENLFKYSDEVEDLGKRVMDKRYYETEDRVKEAHSKLYDKYSNPNNIMTRSLRRNPNSLEDEKGDKEFRQCLSIKGRKEPCLKRKKVMLSLRDDDKKFPYNNVDIDDLKFRLGGKNDKSLEDVAIERRNDPYTDIVRSVNGQDFRSIDAQDLKSRRVYRKEFEKSSNYYDDLEAKGKLKEIYDDPLTIERRKFYQDKLDKLERKMHSSRNFRRRSEFEREPISPRRYVRPTNRDVVVPQLKFRSKAKKNPLYIPDRARFLHGF